MGVYGLVWTQIGHWYRYPGTAVLIRYLMQAFLFTDFAAHQQMDLPDF